MSEAQLKPREILDPERFRQYEQEPAHARVETALSLIRADGLKVLDVGGASGVFLNELDKRSSFRSELFNLEVDERHQQINPRINFVHGSILNSGLADNAYDLVTLRHVLHHLVGNTLRDTLNNQRTAIEEACRITRGYVLLEEEVNNVKAFSRIVYWLSKMANRFNIKSKTFDAGTVIVSFLTPAEIHSLINGMEIVSSDYVPWDMPLRWKLTVIMSSVGHVSYVLKKPQAVAKGLKA